VVGGIAGGWVGDKAGGVAYDVGEAAVDELDGPVSGAASGIDEGADWVGDQLGL
jgi:hypothetical protein